MSRTKVVSRAALALGSLVWTDDASQSPKAVMYSKQIGGTGKQPPIA